MLIQIRSFNAKVFPRAAHLGRTGESRSIGQYRVVKSHLLNLDFSWGWGEVREGNLLYQDPALIKNRWEGKKGA